MDVSVNSLENFSIPTKGGFWWDTEALSAFLFWLCRGEVEGQHIFTQLLVRQHSSC